MITPNTLQFHRNRNIQIILYNVTQGIIKNNLNVFDRDTIGQMYCFFNNLRVTEETEFLGGRTDFKKVGRVLFDVEFVLDQTVESLLYFFKFIFGFECF